MLEVSSADEYLICGPGDMVDEVRNALKALNGTAAIRFERFADRRAAAAGDPRRQERRCADRRDAPAQEVLATISVVMDGRRRSFPMAPGDAVGARRRRTRGTRAAVFLPIGHLRNLPRENHRTARR